MLKLKKSLVRTTKARGLEKKGQPTDVGFCLNRAVLLVLWEIGFGLGDEFRRDGVLFQ